MTAGGDVSRTRCEGCCAGAEGLHGDQVLDARPAQGHAPAFSSLNLKPCLRVQVEMYADPVARGGVLEPEGIVEIKFRTPDLLKAMHRLDPVIRKLKDEAGPDCEQAIKDREGALLPVYRQVRGRLNDACLLTLQAEPLPATARCHAINLLQLSLSRQQRSAMPSTCVHGQGSAPGLAHRNLLAILVQA